MRRTPLISVEGLSQALRGCRGPGSTARRRGRAGSCMRSTMSSFEVAAARRSASSANPAAANPRWRAASCGCYEPGRRRASASTAWTCCALRGAERRAYQPPRPDGLPGPLQLAQPAHDGAPGAGRGARACTRLRPQAGCRARITRAARSGAPAGATRPTAIRTSSPAASASASASRARLPSSRIADRRRAGLGARRLGAGADHQLLLELQSQLQLTVLFVAHDLRLVRHISHRVAVMYLGRSSRSARPSGCSPRRPIPTPPLCSPPRPRSTRRAAHAGRRRGRAAESVRGAYRLRLPDALHRASDRCAMIRPPLAPTGDGRMVACHHPLS